MSTKGIALLVGALVVLCAGFSYLGPFYYKFPIRYVGWYTYCTTLLDSSIQTCGLMDMTTVAWPWDLKGTTVLEAIGNLMYRVTFGLHLLFSLLGLLLGCSDGSVKAGGALFFVGASFAMSGYGFNMYEIIYNRIPVSALHAGFYLGVIGAVLGYVAGGLLASSGEKRGAIAPSPSHVSP